MMFFGPSKRQLLRILERERLAFAEERAMLIEKMAELAGRPLTTPRWERLSDHHEPEVLHVQPPGPYESVQ